MTPPPPPPPPQCISELPGEQLHLDLLVCLAPLWTRQPCLCRVISQNIFPCPAYLVDVAMTGDLATALGIPQRRCHDALPHSSYITI